MTENGLITLPSAHSAKATADRLAAEIAAKGMTVFARIDHAAGAKEVGMALRPTEVLIFGNAKGGTPLMAAKQTIGIDLPLKALVWEDAAGKAWLILQRSGWIAQRHGAAGVAEVTGRLAAALAGLAMTATGA